MITPSRLERTLYSVLEKWGTRDNGKAVADLLQDKRGYSTVRLIMLLERSSRTRAPSPSCYAPDRVAPSGGQSGPDSSLTEFGTQAELPSWSSCS